MSTQTRPEPVLPPYSEADAAATHRMHVETLRRQQHAEVNAAPPPADGMTTDQATALYEFQGFAAPYVVVKRRSDGQKGTLTFTNSPRRYFDFTPT